MANILLLEDEPVLREELAEFLHDQGHQVSTAATLAAFRRTFVPGVHNIVLLDRGLPDGDGLDLLPGLRRGSAGQLGIIVFTARGATPDKVQGLLDGADHYLPKVADLPELAATIAALARRLQPAPEHGADLAGWLLQRSPMQLVPPGGAPIPLSAQDYAVLQTLALHPQGASRRAIVEAFGQQYLDYDQRRLDTQMRRLRRKVEQCGWQLPVSTLRNVGYRFHAALRSVA